MKITSFEFAFIKSFKSLKFDLETTNVLIGQNDHGKSSILKSIDIVMNEIPTSAAKRGALHPDLAQRLLPLFPVNAKARRIAINYESGGSKKSIYITVRADLSFTVLEKIEKGAVTTDKSIATFKRLRDSNKFVLIPALRDAASDSFKEFFSQILRDHVLQKFIPEKAGGTPKEYRALKQIRDQVTTTIKPYINDSLLPEIEKQFGFQLQHKLGLTFDVDVQRVGEWIIDNLQLGFQLTKDDSSTLSLLEAGSGVQSAALLALHRVEQKAASDPATQYILAIEEPETFLHPQRQKELYQDILKIQSNNLRVIVTTHSPYIVAETPFSKLGLVRKEDQHSIMCVPTIASDQEREMFDAYSNEVNSQIFFADKVIIVEGESEQRVLKVLLQKAYTNAAHHISIISASGNTNFSPLLKMIRAWKEAKIPHLILTDFDSLVTTTGRAVLTGAKAAGYAIPGEAALLAKIDWCLDKGETEFTAAAIESTKQLAAAGLNVFVFSSDLEHSLVTQRNKDKVAAILTEHSSTGNNYSTGYDLIQLAKHIGSKGIPLNPINQPAFKKPFIHRKIAETVELAHAHPDIDRLLNAIDAL